MTKTPHTPSPVDHPTHYNSHPSGVECIVVAEAFGFNLGNVVKYLWRADQKGAPIEDLKKARWYLDREISRREKRAPVKSSLDAFTAVEWFAVRHGGTAHKLDSFQPGMVAVMKCGVVLPQWRGGDGCRKCRKCLAL